MSKMLMKVQVGPVQEFIAQARSTRDMWAGSYLLAWMTAIAMKRFQDAGCTFVFPTLDDQPLYEMVNGRPSNEGLIPTLPNVFMLLVEADQVETLAQQAKEALMAELKQIADAGWKKMEALGALGQTEWKTRWDAQVNVFPIFNWHAVDSIEGTEWSDTVNELGTQMAARRNTREFSQWGSWVTPCGKIASDKKLSGSSKDVLSGKEEIIGDETFWSKSYWKGAGPYGAMNCIKRLFPETYLERKFESRKAFWSEMGMKNTRDIAAGNQEGTKGVDTNHEAKPLNPYMAVIVMDGDRMGAALKTMESRAAHRRFSQTLAIFAEKNVMRVLTQFSFGTAVQLVYAGGDDVLVMCPADRALELAKALRDEFVATMTEYIDPQAEDKLDASCGIAVGHYMFPLQRIVDEARKAEHRAKNQRGRAAFALSLLKRSGEIIHWGGRWESNALSVYRDFTEKSQKGGAFSGRFPYALAELLQPYQIADEHRSIDFERLKEVIEKEFNHVLDRQALQKDADVSGAVEYLHQLGEKQLEDFPNLFLASAFMNRQRGEN